MCVMELNIAGMGLMSLNVFGIRNGGEKISTNSGILNTQHIMEHISRYTKNIDISYIVTSLIQRPITILKTDYHWNKNIIMN